MEYFKKKGYVILEELIYDEKEISIKEFLKNALKIVDAVSEIHKDGIIYKYLNPQNIIIDSNGEVKLMESTFMCRDINYNLRYMAPEQIGRIKKSIDFSTDHYSLGVIFYRMLTGKLPIEVDDEIKLSYCNTNKRPVSPKKIKSTIPLVISKIIMKLLEKDSEKRYKSIYGIKVDLNKCYKSLIFSGEVYNFPLGERDVSDKLKFTNKIYGREKEIEIIMDRYHRACKGTLQCVAISGESGMGKTVIGNEISKKIAQEGGILLSSKCKKYNNNVPYYPLIECTRILINKILMEDEEKIRNLKKDILKEIGDNGQLITKLVPEAEFLIGKQPPLEERGFIQSKSRFNMVIIRFIRTILKMKKPIAVFLEDIQWLDESSLYIIKKFLLNEENKYLFILTTFRKTDVKNNNFLKQILEQKIVLNIELESLNKYNIENLICDTLYCSKEEVKDLVKFINIRTDGNPFLVKTSIDSMYLNGVLKFDYNNNKWQWNMNLLKDMKIENSIFEIIIRKISQLSYETKEILRVASCIGQEFALKDISNILDKSINTIFNDIIPAITEGAIILDEYATKDSRNKVYRFSHSQIQMQVYDSISREKKERYHLIIGRYFYNKFLNKNLESRLFGVVNQLNKGRGLINNRDEIYKLIKLNLTVGLKEKESGIHKLALGYFEVAYNLLEENSWEKNYELTYEVIIELAECEFMNKNFKKAEDLFEIILKNVRTPWEAIKIYNMKVCIYTYFREIDKAIETGINGLRVLGIHISEKPSVTKVCYETFKFKLMKKSMVNINRYIIKENDIREELRKLFFNMSFLAILYDKKLFILLVLKEMQINLYNSKSNNDVFTKINYEFLIMNLLKKYSKSYEMALKDLKKCYKKIDTIIYAKAYTVFSNFMVLWSEGYSTTLEHLYKCYDICMCTGEVTCASLTLNNIITVFLLKGENLLEVKDKIKLYIEDIEKSNFDDIRDDLVLNKKIIDILISDNEDKELIFSKEHTLGSECLGIYTYRIMLNYMMGNYEDSIEIIKRREDNSNLNEFYIDSLYYIFTCLTTIKLFERCSESQKRNYEKKIRTYMKIIRKKTNANPSNFLSMYTLIKAEVGRVLNKGYKSERLYDEAIKIATKNNMINNIALISEIAGNHYKSQGNITVSKLYLIQAYTFYKRWGCMLKVKDLENKYPEIFKNSSCYYKNNYSSINDIVHKLYIDDIFECSIEMKRNKYEFMKFLKAFQSISGEIVLEKLLKELMINLIGSVEAERGCLILNKDNKLFIEAEGEVDDICSIMENPIALDEYQKVSKFLVNYVLRTKKSILLDNGKCNDIVFDDKYIVENNVKSILCTPIIAQENIIGIIYLENRFSSGIFNEKRLNIVELIASQAAISIENAFMYEKINTLNKELKNTVDERTKLLNESIKYEEMRTEFFANISHELRTPLNVIFSGYQMLNVLLKSEDLKNEEKINKYMGIMKQNCYRLVRLINNLIDITKIDSGFFELNMININIVNIVETITLSVAQYIESKGINLVFDTFIEEKIMACDVDKIERIILNLLSNAVKFTNKGGNIFVTMNEDKEDNIIISVKDDGIGIPDEKQDIIFDRFIQVDKSLSRNREGSGIGLALVKSIIELHDGSISLKSKLGHGSEFIIKLPCKVLEKQNKSAKKYRNANSNKIEKIMIEFSDIYS